MAPIKPEADDLYYMGKLNRLGKVLIEAGLVSEEDLVAALKHQASVADSTGHWPRLGSVLVGMGVLGEEEIARALSIQLGVPLIDLSQVDGIPDLVAAVPRRLAERHAVVPVRATDTGLILAMADPTDVIAVDDIRVSSHVGHITVAVAPASAIREAIIRFYSTDSDATELLKRLGDAADARVMPETTDVEVDEQAASRGPIIQLGNAILADAVNARATDIHVEPQQSEVKVRYRIDGLLRDVMTLPKSVHAPLVSRLKIASGMDISERRRPQDGRGRFEVDGLAVSLRMSTIPTLQGEKIVIRLLRQDEHIVRLEDLGFDPEQLAPLVAALDSPQGFVLFSGPTGSGKTTTLYTGLSRGTDAAVNIVTLEDPIEYQLPGVNQMQIDERTGVTFAKGLRSVLRQDPNVIMVGEIRDAETASIALQAAMTGHLVLSTVHTNDASSAIARLIDLGVEPFLIAGALSMVVAQRLVRRICDDCKQPATPNVSTLERLGIREEALVGATLFRGVGCQRCGFTGYYGRTAVFEVLPVSRQIRELITANVSETAITRVARAAGIRSLLDAGLRKAKAGITTLEEVLRAVQQDDAERVPTCPACRHEVDPGFVVCPHCQFALSGPRCPQCARDVKIEWAACPYCRSELHIWKAAATAERQRILIVDDDAHLRMLVSTMFGDEYDVIEASGGEEALRHATLHRPDVVLLDLHMPDVSGIELAKRMRASAATSLIPIIMVTGDDSGEIEGLRAGVDDYIVKPFDEPRLRARIERVLTPRR